MACANQRKGCLGGGFGCDIGDSKKSSSSMKSSASSATNYQFENTTTIQSFDIQEESIVRELNQLSFQERERVYEEVHGVAKAQEETPEFVSTCLSKMKKEIDNLSRGKRRAIDRAFFLKPTLRQDQNFFLMFLRADRFDAYDAANRMAKYFTCKLVLFGEEKLVKELTLDDLDDDDMDCVYRGSNRFLKQKDRAGRFLSLVCPLLIRCKDWKNQMRCIWYIMMTALLENVEAQIGGLVVIIYLVGQQIKITDSNFAAFLSQSRTETFMSALPHHIRGVHFCYSDNRFKPILTLMRMVCDRYARLRFRTHFGTDEEVQYALMSFGIPRDAIPIQQDGTYSEDTKRQFVTERLEIESERKRRSEEEMEKTKLIPFPRPNDVLLGRGRPFQASRGNLKLLGLVDEQRAEYQNTEDRFEKTMITLNIVKKIQDEYNGRFLQRTPLGWVEVNEMAARDKVSHSLRTKVAPKKATVSKLDEDQPNKKRPRRCGGPVVMLQG